MALHYVVVLASFLKMNINENTKIGTLIKHNILAIEAIVSIHPVFSKLRNPFLRKILASRVTIKEAAKIGGTSVEAFFEVLASIGFKIDKKQTQTTNCMEVIGQSIEEALKGGKVKQLDVRPLLANNVDPFKQINDAIKDLPTDYVLELINTFEPVPLIKILHQRGYESAVVRQGEVVTTYFLKQEKTSVVEEKEQSSIIKISLEQLEDKRYSLMPPFRELDVRELEMPLPMLTILRELEGLPQGEGLFVHHKKIPQYLLPELKARGMKTWIAEVDDNNVKLLIHY